MEHLFRNAAFGGFNRQDVMDYLEKITSQNNQELEQQRSQNQTLQTQLDEAKQTLDRESSMRKQLEAERDELRRKLEQLQNENHALREESVRLNAQCSEAKAQAQQLRAQVEKLEPDAQAYTAVKDRPAGVELQAHRRALDVEQQAQEYARRLKGQMEQWLAAVEQQYDALRHEVESTVSHAADQLSKAGASLEKVNQLMDGQDVELKLLVQSYQESETTGEE